MALELTHGKPSGSCKKLLVWLARAYDAGCREWVPQCVIAKLVDCSEAEVKRALAQLKKLPAQVTGCCVQEHDVEHGHCGSIHEYRLTDDGLLYALDAWPKEVLEPMEKSVTKHVRGVKAGQYLHIAQEQKKAAKAAKEAAKKQRKRAA